MNALVVENSIVMRQVIKESLARCGMADVRVFDAVQESLEPMRGNGCALAVIAWDASPIPGLDWIIEARKCNGETPIIVIIPENERHAVLEAMKAGADDYILKPFEPSTILAKVQAVLKRASRP